MTTATASRTPPRASWVIGVGGTSLASSGSTRGWAETAWDGAGSGCSKYTTTPSWQIGGHAGCAHKMVSDLSAVADPNTGVAVYDKYGSGGWAVYGGTSVASPLVASIFAATGHANAYGATVWKHTADFFDVTSGSNGTCKTSYFCTAGKGYDGPTGWGTPNATKLAAWGAADRRQVGRRVIAARLISGRPLGWRGCMGRRRTPRSTAAASFAFKVIGGCVAMGEVRTSRHWPWRRSLCCAGGKRPSESNGDVAGERGARRPTMVQPKTTAPATANARTEATRAAAARRARVSRRGASRSPGTTGRTCTRWSWRATSTRRT